MTLAYLRVAAAFVFAAPLPAQALSAGLRAGIGMTRTFRGQAAGETAQSRFTVGPWLELGLWRGAGLGVDFLVRHTAVEVVPEPSRMSMWRAEVPVTFVYRFRRNASPFLRMGVAWNRVFGVGGARVAELRHRGTRGFVAGVGAGWRLYKVRVEPELRLTRWFDRNFGVRDSGVRSNLDEVLVLVGFRF